MTFGHSLPGSGNNSSILCNEIVANIQSGAFLPEFIVISEMDDGLAPFEICNKTILSLKRNSKQLYSLEKTFGGDIVPFDS